MMLSTHSLDLAKNEIISLVSADTFPFLLASDLLILLLFSLWEGLTW